MAVLRTHTVSLAFPSDGENWSLAAPGFQFTSVATIEGRARLLPFIPASVLPLARPWLKTHELPEGSQRPG